MKHTFDYGKIRTGLKHRADLCLIAGILLLAGGIALFVSWKGGKEPAAAVIEQDGRELMRLSLVKEQTVRIPAEKGYNVVSVTPQGVCVTEADCPDQICVKQGEITASGESIICLPHKLVIRLSGAGQEGPDAVTD